MRRDDDTAAAWRSLSNDRSRREYVLALAGLASVGLAGCSSDDVARPEEVTDGTGDGTDRSTAGDGTPESADRTGSTPGTVDAALGEVIEGDQLALVAYSVERRRQVGQFTRADEGNEFVVVEMAAKNRTSEEFMNFSSFLQVSLHDDEDYEYDQTITGSGGSLDSGELAPGEVTRGTLVFEVPEGTSGLALHVDLDQSIIGYDGVEIDLASRGSGRTLTQDLQVEVYETGDTLDYQDTRFTVNSVRTSSGEGFAQPDEGNEFVLVDVTVENTGDDELTVSTLLQMELKDGRGRTYDISIVGASVSDRDFSQGDPIPPGGRRRGEVVFEAPEGIDPLYLVMDFDVFAEGDKSFFQLR
ncbi:hypothetical protein BV210_04465 [Halorientalis sp. IM1011]|uniref:DUF4352 domain-containing protein n=1 Tax=Halorientalis sp. IM1011 TaxID=1932360 RepID=UPI00097CCFC2|nr:DUF4352 domain-containing protein [Halorientalis sp. IM1011]AQL42016.1 hypothetical protein BV210_04465 [Halorientalis sp. IM1011]